LDVHAKGRRGFLGIHSLSGNRPFSPVSGIWSRFARKKVVKDLAAAEAQRRIPKETGKMLRYCPD
jgi:hypothetical protein